MTLRTLTTAAAVSIVLLLHAPRTLATADDIVVMTSGAFTATYLELGPGFERATGHRLVTATTSTGVGADAIPARLSRREPADVIILPAEALDDLERKGLVQQGSRVDLARSTIGMAVRAGARKPDISSVDGLRRALLAATSVAYSSSVSGDYLVNELFPRLGIAEAMKKTGRRIERERVGAVVARGDAEIGFQQVSELLPIEGIDFVGPLPADVQRVTTISAGVAAHATHPEAARRLVAYLASPDATPVLVKTGMDPINRR